MTDQVDALDEILYGTIGIGYAGKPPHNQNSLKKVVGIQDAKAKLSALLVNARLKERRQLDADINAKTFSDATDWRREYLRISIKNSTAIKELEKQREEL